MIRYLFMLILADLVALTLVGAIMLLTTAAWHYLTGGIL